jgi:hypothetical protein
MEETVLRVLRMLADGVIGPRVHELLDELEAAGHAPAAPPARAPLAPALPPVTTPFGGTK